MKYSRRKVDEECLDCAQYLFEIAMLPERAESFGISLPPRDLTRGERDVLFSVAHFLSLYGRTDISGYPSVVKDVRSISEEAAVGKGEVSNALKTFREMGLVETKVAEDVPGHPYRWTFTFYSKPHPGTYDDNDPLSFLDFIEEGGMEEGATSMNKNSFINTNPNKSKKKALVHQSGGSRITPL